MINLSLVQRNASHAKSRAAPSTWPQILRVSTSSPSFDFILRSAGSRLKFYNLHQTLNTSINALNSFLVIYLISSARTGFVFFISFTSFFLTLICPNHILSGMSCQACCLVLVAWPQIHWTVSSRVLVQWTRAQAFLNISHNRAAIKTANMIRSSIGDCVNINCQNSTI